MEKNLRFMVKWDGQMPTLLRIEPDEKEKVFYSGNFEYSSNFYWIYAPELEDIVDHKERFPEYSDISDEEAAKIKRQLETEYARIEEEKNVIHTEHSQKSTEKGIAFIDTYTKAKERHGFRSEELEKLLSSLAEKEHMIIQKIDYCFFDYWGYRKYRTSTSKEDIHEICDIPLAIDGYFTDQEMNYRFMYLSDDNIVIVAKCLKEADINLKAFFDDETNRKAGGFLNID